MSSEFEPQTGTALLGLLHDPANPQSWREFVECYRPRIYAWCRQWRLQDADAQNVTQEVLTKLVSKLRGFDYDPSRGRFRGWLKTVTSHACRDYVEKQRQPGRRGSGDPSVMGLLDSLEARQGLSSPLDREKARELLQQAELRVRQCVSVRDWNIFQALAIKGRSGIEVAEEHGIKAAAVFMVRSRIQQKLRREAQRLEAIDSPCGKERS